MGNLIQEDVLKLLEEYKYRSGGKIKVTVVQPFLDFQGAQKLAEKFKLTSNENVVILGLGFEVEDKIAEILKELIEEEKEEEENNEKVL